MLLSLDLNFWAQTILPPQLAQTTGPGFLTVHFIITLEYTASTYFFKNVKSHAGSPGAIPEEGIVNLGDDSSIHVIASEDLPTGQFLLLLEVKDSDS